MSELVHFGVKGMRWGVRKDKTGSAADDKKRFGVRGERRIAKREAKGRTREQAVTTERRIKTAKIVAVTVYGAFFAKNLIVRFGPEIASSVVAKKVAKNGAKAAANLLADGHGLTNYSTINLAFNAGRNVWE